MYCITKRSFRMVRFAGGFAQMPRRYFSSTQLDHLVVLSPQLSQGVSYVEEVLGVEMGPVGKHSMMGTHNRLVNVSSELFPNSYLEVISIDPDATPEREPPLKRWFDMDQEYIKNELSTHGPQLLHWVSRTPDLMQAQQLCLEHDIDCGKQVTMVRGDLSWDLCVRDDGVRPQQGIVPMFISWHGPGHPTRQLPFSGVELINFTLEHPDHDKRTVFDSLEELPYQVDINSGPELRLLATFRKADGVEVVISSRGVSL